MTMSSKDKAASTGLVAVGLRIAMEAGGKMYVGGVNKQAVSQAKFFVEELESAGILPDLQP